MKVVATIAKILAALAAVAGAVYLLATYGDKIVAWAKGIMAKLPSGCCDCDDCPCECEDDCDECTCEADCDECPCECSCECEEEAPVEEVPAEETPVEAPAADEADFEG